VFTLTIIQCVLHNPAGDCDDRVRGGISQRLEDLEMVLRGESAFQRQRLWIRYFLSGLLAWR